MSWFEIVLIIFSICFVWVIMGIFPAMMLEDFRISHDLHWSVDLLICTILFGPIGLFGCLYFMHKEYREIKKSNEYWDNWVLENCNVKNEKIK